MNFEDKKVDEGYIVQAAGNQGHDELVAGKVADKVAGKIVDRVVDRVVAFVVVVDTNSENLAFASEPTSH